MTDLKCALDAHIECLARCGITYDGRLGLDEGSKLYGRAFRLYRTGYMIPCDCRPGYTNLLTGVCTVCNDAGQRPTTGHARPPVGDDYLGMTKSEAYETLTARTRAIYDTAAAVKP
jgi:hypothetical protein